MKKQTREKFNQLKLDAAQTNGVMDVTEKFTVTPAVEQRLVDQMGESSDFLKSINIIGVTEQKGQKLGLGVGSPIGSRTNTDTKERETAYVGSLVPDPYEAMQTNFDTHLSYRMMDAWAAFADFNKRYRKHVMKRMALDRILIGWNGTSAAAETDRATSPLLQDVNIGWLEKVRRNAPARMMGYDSTGQETTDTYNVGEGGQYPTLDALVFDMMSNLLDPWNTGSDDLVLILGRELWVKHGLELYAENRPATERNALQVWFARQAVAGLPTITVPFFPERGAVVTSYDNLSIYFQSGAVRRAIIDNPKRDRVEEYLSSNDAYVVEDYGKFGGIRAGAVKLKNAAGNWV
ncbi:MAG: phage major capsid protein, P2 family [Thiothrix lacustris]|uniref:Phage major capsid protein, P2 family n=2 Tax=Thiothrix TaxID=1030 RepID=A0A975IHX7_9GAMM|nr:phage major capsid protein, P2 family [Thiothrix unzii]OQX07488.1 MAG: phage major capsid protein, P2 family [Thiothrix lacustris]QTR53120.1 phage major capsid protein, P2 family [Thiothrix unzii]